MAIRLKTGPFLCERRLPYRPFQTAMSSSVPTSTSPFKSEMRSPSDWRRSSESTYFTLLATITGARADRAKDEPAVLSGNGRSICCSEDRYVAQGQAALTLPSSGGRGDTAVKGPQTEAKGLGAGDGGWEIGATGAENDISRCGRRPSHALTPALSRRARGTDTQGAKKGSLIVARWTAIIGLPLSPPVKLPGATAGLPNRALCTAGQASSSGTQPNRYSALER